MLKFKPYILVILFAIIVIYRFYRKKATPKDSIQDKNLLTKKDYEDFQKVGSGGAKENVKPVDQTGDVIQHARETLDEDLENLKPPRDG